MVLAHIYIGYIYLKRDRSTYFYVGLFTFDILKKERKKSIRGEGLGFLIVDDDLSPIFLS